MRRIYESRRNLILELGDYTEVILKNIKGKETGRALVDIADLDRVREFTWYLGSNGYVQSVVLIEGKKTMIRLHRLLLNPPKSLVVDHISRNKLDNTRSNLRVVTVSQNGMNTDRGGNNRGVIYETRRSKWRAQIQKDKKCIFLGYFSSFTEARKTRIIKELEIFGKFSSLANGK